MLVSEPIYVKEYSVLYIDGERHNPEDVPISRITFENLWNAVLENKATGLESIMSLHSRSGRKFIRLGKYVGTIQTKDGGTIEILPKIYKSDGTEEKEISNCKSIFLRMLKHFPSVISRTFQTANIESLNSFPLLEVFINGYLDAISVLLQSGLKRGYQSNIGIHSYLRGQLVINRQILQNLSDMSKFVCKSEVYSPNIPHNRIIVSTLHKLIKISRNSVNRIRANTLITAFDGVAPSVNVQRDFILTQNSGRLYDDYHTVLDLSFQILQNKGFTSFSGEHISQSLLFPADMLFEGFIAHLFKKYATSEIIHPQHRSYYLVDNHSGKSLFQLRPDLYVETIGNRENIIIDTKWKTIDEKKAEYNYLIDIRDMYQLFAYGKKYEFELSKKLKLILIYPYTSSFTSPLKPFVYESIGSNIGLNLLVVPFYLSDPSTYQAQVRKILKDVF